MLTPDYSVDRAENDGEALAQLDDATTEDLEAQLETVKSEAGFDERLLPS